MDQESHCGYESWGVVCSELTAVFREVSKDAYMEFVRHFEGVSAGRVFFFGQGRSGLSAQMAAMRFMHLGMDSHFVGEATAPSVRSGDTLVIVSGSGNTPVGVEFAQIAKSEGAKVVLVTHQIESRLRELADASIVIPASQSKQFGGSLFEQSALVMLDSVVFELMRGLTDPHATMLYSHTNLQ